MQQNAFSNSQKGTSSTWGNISLDGADEGQNWDMVMFLVTALEMVLTGLTHYQTINFRLFQTERVCRQQFQILQKMQKVIQMGRKHSGKRRNCSL